MNEEIVVVAMRVKDQSDHVAGATVRHCKECGLAVWFAPSSPQDAKVMCLPCASDLVPWDDPDFELMKPSAAQKAEHDEFFRRKKS